MNSASVVIDILLRTSGVSLVVLLLTTALRRSSAAAKSSALRIGFLALALAPLSKLVLPVWCVPGWSTSPSTPAAVSDLVLSIPENVRPETSSVAALPLPLFVTWILGASLVLCWVCAGIAMLMRKKKALSGYLPEPLQSQLEAIVGNRRVDVRVELADSPPMTWGHFRPTIVLPAEAVSWSFPRLKSVLEHELAHVDRHDFAVSLVVKFLLALYWFNPIVWVLSRQLDAESEKAADDRALNRGCKPVEYAYHLLETASAFQAKSKALSLAMARPRSLRSRLSSVLMASRRREPLPAYAVFGLTISLTMLSALAATAGPTPEKVSVAPLPVAAEIASPGEVPLAILKETPPAKVAALHLPRVVVAHRRTVRLVDRAPRAARRKFLIHSKAAPKSVEPEPGFAKAMEDVKRQSQKLAAQLSGLSKLSKADARKAETSETNIDVQAMNFDSDGVRVRVPAIHVHIPKIKIPKVKLTANDKSDSFTITMD